MIRRKQTGKILLGLAAMIMSVAVSAQAQPESAMNLISQPLVGLQLYTLPSNVFDTHNEIITNADASGQVGNPWWNQYTLPGNDLVGTTHTIRWC